MAVGGGAGAPGAPGARTAPAGPGATAMRAIWAVGGATGPPTPAGGRRGRRADARRVAGRRAWAERRRSWEVASADASREAGPRRASSGAARFGPRDRARPRAEAGRLGSREAGKGVVGRQAGVLGGSRSRRKTGPGRARGPNASRSSLGARPRRENQHRPSTKPRRGRDPKIRWGRGRTVRHHRLAVGWGRVPVRPGRRLHRVSSRASRRAREQVGPRLGRRLEAEQGMILSPARGRSFATGNSWIFPPACAVVARG